MQRFAILFVIALGLTLGGCCSKVIKREAVVQEALAARMVDLLDKGQTTREDEQAFIRATAKAWTTFREAVGAEKGKVK